MTGLWEFLSRDVAFLGGPYSPMLSWLGSLGLLAFFLWHVIKLKKEVTSIQLGFDGIRPRLITLINARGDIDRERFIHDPEREAKSRANQSIASNMRIDSDDMNALDAEMENQPMFRSLWSQYRMTLILERVPWFMEPRIFSTKRAEEVFTQEAILANRVNLPFYSQFPSLVTGMGLLLTFIALFIGLGKLHAEGSEIVGIQGLINGLAGKFLTSIVGLIVANMFTFIEKPMMSRLLNAHHTFLGLIDQLFPRKTMEQMLEHLTSMHGERQGERLPTGGTNLRETGDGSGMNGLAGPVANLTSVIQSLKRLQEDEHTETRQTLSELPRTIREELHAPLRELTDTIHDLTKALQESKTQHTAEELVNEPVVEHRPLLWRASSNLVSSSGANRSKKTKSWPRWPRTTTMGRTG